MKHFNNFNKYLRKDVKFEGKEQNSLMEKNSKFRI